MLSRVSPHHLLPKQSLFIKLRLGKKEETFIVSFDFFSLTQIQITGSEKAITPMIGVSKVFIGAQKKNLQQYVFTKEVQC